MQGLGSFFDTTINWDFHALQKIYPVLSWWLFIYLVYLTLPYQKIEAGRWLNQHLRGCCCGCLLPGAGHDSSLPARGEQRSPWAAGIICRHPAPAGELPGHWSAGGTHTSLGHVLLWSLPSRSSSGNTASPYSADLIWQTLWQPKPPVN